MLMLLAAVAACQVCALAGPLEAAPLDADGPPQTGAAALIATAIDRSGEALAQFRLWVLESYARAPALMLGLSILLAVPTLALAGLFVRGRRHSPDATIVLRRPSRRQRDAEPATMRTEVSAWPTEAWVEADGAPGRRWVIGRTLLRIGREEDNDICLATHTVHRYHAVIRRTTDGDVVITDTSGAEGNGVLVNGKGVAEARLAKGDRITVGTIELRFDARPV
jgi:hypothetical protein